MKFPVYLLPWLNLYCYIMPIMCSLRKLYWLINLLLIHYIYYIAFYSTMSISTECQYKWKPLNLKYTNAMGGNFSFCLTCFVARQENATIVEEAPSHAYHLFWREFLLLIVYAFLQNLYRTMKKMKTDHRVIAKERPDK